MSPELEDAIIGQLVRERREAKNRLDLLSTQLFHTRETLKKLIGLMENNAHLIWFEGVSTGATPADREGDYLSGRIRTFRVEEIDGRKIADLTSQIREAQKEYSRLSDEASKYDL
jgi:hypothetical protein